MEHFFETVARDTFKYYVQKTPNVEFEFRLGRQHAKGFDTNVGEETFAKVLRGLKNYKDWEAVKVSETEVYSYDNGIRYTLDTATDESETIQKTTVKKLDYRFGEGTTCPFDLRFSVASEKPMGTECPEGGGEPTRMVQKYRESFIRKNLSIDMTILTGDHQGDPDTEDEQIYQIELEIIDPMKVQSDNDLYAHCHKVKCLLDLL